MENKEVLSGWYMRVLGTRFAIPDCVGWIVTAPFLLYMYLRSHSAVSQTGEPIWMYEGQAGSAEFNRQKIKEKDEQVYEAEYTNFELGNMRLVVYETKA